MTRLTSGDLRRVLDSVAVLNSDVDLASLPERTLRSVMSLIPNEVTAFDGFDTEGFYTGSLWYAPDAIVSVEVVEHFADLVDEHPNFGHAVATSDFDAYRMSDYLPHREFQRTALYNEFYRLFSADAQILAALRVSETTVITCAVHRKKSDFTDREFEMVRLITPHLKAAFKNAQVVDQLDRRRRYLDKVVAKGVVVLDDQGKVTFESELARDMMSCYFPARLERNLPAAVRDFVTAQASAFSGGANFDPRKYLAASKGSSELRITVAPDSQEREVLIFLEERLPHGVSDFEKAGISRREAEILFWVSRGKTDPEIATLLSISPRTVHKHLEHIFTKLGVETRTAAVLQTIDFFV